MTAHAEDMVLVPRAELDARSGAENRRLRRKVGDLGEVLSRRIRPDSREGRTFTREELAEAWGISEVIGSFASRTGVWDELEGLPQPLRNAAHRATFHLLEEPVLVLADPFPELDSLQGALSSSPSFGNRSHHLVHGHEGPVDRPHPPDLGCRLLGLYWFPRCTNLAASPCSPGMRLLRSMQAPAGGRDGSGVVAYAISFTSPANRDEPKVLWRNDGAMFPPCCARE